MIPRYREMSPVSDRQRMNRQIDMEFRQRGLRPPGLMDSRTRDPELDQYLSSSLNDFQRSRGPDRPNDYQRNPRPAAADYFDDDLPMPSRGGASRTLDAPPRQSQRPMEPEYRSSRPIESNRGDSRMSRNNPDLDQYMSSALSDFQRSRGGGPNDSQRSQRPEFRDEYRQERPTERSSPIEYPSRYLNPATQRPSERSIEYPSRYLDPSQRSSAIERSIERPTESVFSSRYNTESERIARVAPQPPRLTDQQPMPKGILKSSHQYSDVPSLLGSGRPEPLFRAYAPPTSTRSILTSATSSQNYSDHLRVERELRQAQSR